MPDPQAESTFLKSKMNWDLQVGGKHKVIREFYRDLLELRARTPALSELSKVNQEVVAFVEQNTLFVRRWSGKSNVFVAFHFGDGAVEIEAPVPAGRWRKTLYSANHTERVGQVQESEYLNSTGLARFALAPWQFCLFVKTDDRNE
jgi:maltooligosyltrehalose trehalohydrolase